MKFNEGIEMTAASAKARLASGAAVCALAAMLATGCEKGTSAPYMQKTGESASSFVNPKPEDIVEDKETGLSVIKGVLNVNFSPKMSREDAEKIIAAAGGQVAGHDYSVNFFQARFPLDQAALDKKRLELLGKAGVEMVSPATVSVHKDPYYVK
jgi:hypothetical protein